MFWRDKSVCLTVYKQCTYNSFDKIRFKLSIRKHGKLELTDNFLLVICRCWFFARLLGFLRCFLKDIIFSWSLHLRAACSICSCISHLFTTLIWLQLTRKDRVPPEKYLLLHFHVCKYCFCKWSIMRFSTCGVSLVPMCGSTRSGGCPRGREHTTNYSGVLRLMLWWIPVDRSEGGMETLFSHIEPDLLLQTVLCR